MTVSADDCKSSYSSVTFTNVTIYNTTTTNDSRNSNIASVSVLNINTYAVDVEFRNVNFISNNYLRHGGEVLLIENSGFCNIDFSKIIASLTLADCTFDNNTTFDHVVFLNSKINTNEEFNYQTIYTIKTYDCTFHNNFGGESIVYIVGPISDLFMAIYSDMRLGNSTFGNNKDSVLHVILTRLVFEKGTVFINNIANSGAAIYFEDILSISPYNASADVQFINNSAVQTGGALYFNLAINNCNPFSDPLNATFIINSASIAGNSIYFSIPEVCHVNTNISDKSSLLYIPNKFNYSQPFYITPVVTSPHNIKLYSPAVASHNSSNDYTIPQSKMLGEPIKFTASVFDYFNNITEPVIFVINCKTCANDYVLSTYEITVHDQSLNELKVFPTVPRDVINNKNILITLLSIIPIKYNRMSASLSIQLSSCHAGYVFDKSQRQCVCYPYPGIVHCNGDNSEIKIGYWIGFLTQQHYTSSICPSNYCNFVERTETSQGYYNLPKKPDDQCSSHRTGVACGECKSGYTLAYYSPDCINTEKCSAGMTILVIVLTILYWIAIVAVAFGLMYIRFRMPLGYVYAIIYYYSIVDVLLINDVSEEISELVRILSSLAKLTPQVFGQLCLVEGLSGIDQQFIHYSHALAVSLILLIIVLVARHSGRLTRFIGPCIIRVICLLLLLSYTSLASTSLQLLRPLTFNDVDEVRTYSSPDIKYFTGRHLVYAIVAILCEVIIVIGLPLLLLLEPLLSRLSQRINLVRIKPLLDEFQDSYKGKYRWFAAYYLICRQVIFLIVYVGNGDYYKMLYYLQTACIVIAMVHTCFQPYKNNLLNALDGVILLLSVLVVNLNTFSFLSAASTMILVLLPLLILICFVSIRKFFVCFTRRNIVLHLFNPVGDYGENDDYNNQGR